MDWGRGDTIGSCVEEKSGGGGGWYVCLHFSSGLFLTDSSLMDWERAWRAEPTWVFPSFFFSLSLFFFLTVCNLMDWWMAEPTSLSTWFFLWLVSDRLQSDRLGEGVKGGAYVCINFIPLVCY